MDSEAFSFLHGTDGSTKAVVNGDHTLVISSNCETQSEKLNVMSDFTLGFVGTWKQFCCFGVLLKLSLMPEIRHIPYESSIWDRIVRNAFPTLPG